MQNWIRLAKLESPKKAVALVDYFGSPDAVFSASVDELMLVPGMVLKMAEKVRAFSSWPVDGALRAMERLGARIVTYQDPAYPENLRQIYDMPPMLFVWGELLESDRISVAMIGTRRCTEYGRSMATKISRDLAKQGICIISGGARGIDSASHTAAVLVGGRTIAVLGCGLDVTYPSENRGLFAKIAENGAVITEFAPGVRPEAWRFPARNRLVSGISAGVLVIESKLHGGAMITASHAAEQGRDVWALPGGTDSSVSEGPHRLIKEGAKLVENADDILEELGVTTKARSGKTLSAKKILTPEQKSIMDVLSLHPKAIDDIIYECNLSPSSANSSLTILEMIGLVRRVPGNAYVRAV